MDQMDRRQNIENQKVTEKYQLFILHFTAAKSVLNDCIKKAEYQRGDWLKFGRKTFCWWKCKCVNSEMFCESIFVLQFVHLSKHLGNVVSFGFQSSSFL